jgi:hypothetical protein
VSDLYPEEKRRLMLTLLEAHPIYGELLLEIHAMHEDTRKLLGKRFHVEMGRLGGLIRLKAQKSESSILQAALEVAKTATLVAVPADVAVTAAIEEMIRAREHSR